MRFCVSKKVYSYFSCGSGLAKFLETSEVGKVYPKEVLHFHSSLLQKVVFVGTMVFHCHFPESCTVVVASDR